MHNVHIWKSVYPHTCVGAADVIVDVVMCDRVCVVVEVVGGGVVCRVGNVVGGVEQWHRHQHQQQQHHTHYNKHQQ